MQSPAWRWRCLAVIRSVRYDILPWTANVTGSVFRDHPQDYNNNNFVQNCGNGECRQRRGGRQRRSSDEDSEELWKDHPRSNPFECFLFSPCLISFHFSILLLPSRETDRVKNKTPDTYFTPELFTDRAKRTRRTTTSRFWVIVIWSTLKCVCIRLRYFFVGYIMLFILRRIKKISMQRKGCNNPI